MSTIIQSTASCTIATAPPHRAAITNIGQMLEQLSVGWVDGSPDNRMLIAGEGGQFIRVRPRHYGHCYFKPNVDDIAIDSGSYMLSGFIKFEIPAAFRELFVTARASDGAWASATLTKRGFEMASVGLLDLTGLDKLHPFFGPDMRDIEVEKAISMYKPALDWMGGAA